MIEGQPKLCLLPLVFIYTTFCISYIRVVLIIVVLIVKVKPTSVLFLYIYKYVVDVVALDKYIETLKDLSLLYFELIYL